MDGNGRYHTIRPEDTGRPGQGDVIPGTAFSDIADQAGAGGRIKPVSPDRGPGLRIFSDYKAVRRREDIGHGPGAGRSDGRRRGRRREDGEGAERKHFAVKDARTGPEEEFIGAVGIMVPSPDGHLAAERDERAFARHRSEAGFTGELDRGLPDTRKGRPEAPVRRSTR